MRDRITALWLFDEAAASAGVAGSERACGRPRRMFSCRVSVVRDGFTGVGSS